MPTQHSPTTPYAAVHETHAGVVFLVGERAYKLKKPEDFGFLDYSTRELRRAACLRETELNRRLAPDVYDGVLDVVDAGGRPVEHLVAMRRMPEDRRLSTLVRRGADIGGCLRQIAHLLAAFHSRAARDSRVAAEGAAEALRGRWTSGFAQVRSLPGDITGGRVDEIERLVLRFIDGRRALFSARIAEGRVVDGHGDLLADDVFCLDDGPRVLDCLEFDDRLRFVDGLDDAAFLAMDLERLGAPEAARDFLRRYADLAGDPAPSALHHHYVAYRAFVRAKVAGLRHGQGDPGSGEQARALSALALKHLRAGAVRLILVGGTPATGKSTLAGELADHTGAVRLSSDRLRKETAGIAPTASAAAAYRSGLYAPEATDRVYADLLGRARRLLGLGESVVLDASWSSAAHRAAARALAAETAADLVELRCTADDDVVTSRIAERARTGSESDADVAVARAMAAAFDPWPQAHRVDTSRTSSRRSAREAAAVVDRRTSEPASEPDRGVPAGADPARASAGTTAVPRRTL
ncbi:bifunctional aminoglycoside phosphotransferase/ATP-binding protein [Streptomonospora nanhaiensis]|uniref:Gluconate kinase n=1 Tax=Streptomonospora nanhaiensis TaxID=1323731 RepID=A0A853BK64_9ACTN|nr:AAA family ATPase [Streptomonospora nanhaiensis]MBV2364154.1 AAA family ATPase [Streptomonospora nanhaiensis]NYI95104.1 hypothetical protein [Streptomonospora nanhaiensis]